MPGLHLLVAGSRSGSPESMVDSKQEPRASHEFSEWDSAIGQDSTP